MNTNKECLDKMSSMHLSGMASAFKTYIEQDGSSGPCYTQDELIHFLIQSEWEDRRYRAQQRSIRNAGFRYHAQPEQLDYQGDRGLDRNLVQRLLEGSFIDQASDVFITGSTGTGKSFLASAIGYQACILGYKVYYATTSKLMAQLKVAKAEGSHLKELARIEKAQLFILDDFGVQPLDAPARNLLLDIIEDRHGKRSTMITSQLPVAKWHDIIGEKTVADAILDRIVHQAIRIELYGESMRKKKKIQS